MFCSPLTRDNDVLKYANTFQEYTRSECSENGHWKTCYSKPPVHT